jgi:AdoMet-dependent heme synthase
MEAEGACTGSPLQAVVRWRAPNRKWTSCIASCTKPTRACVDHNLGSRTTSPDHRSTAHESRPTNHGSSSYEPGAPTSDAATRNQSWATRRVNDGKGFVFISHVGNVYPSGFLPIHAGNIRETPLAEIYRNAPIFKALRDTGRLEGKCGACEYKEICGGSRARAYALTGDPLAQEPCCIYQPRNWDPNLASQSQPVRWQETPGTLVTL